MNRYMHTDLYPDFHVTFAKKAKINEIPAVSLSDLGLPYDVDFKEQKLEDLPKEIKDAIICEFMFLIDKLLPRDIQDLFYRIALDPRPAYWSAFEQAANLMQLERYDGHEQGNRKGQLVDHVRQGIQDLIEDGFTLQEIYDSTCVTKDMVTPILIDGDVFYERETLTEEEFYEALIGGKDVTTSQPSPADVIDTWEDLFGMGYNQIVYIPMSSGLSGSCMTAKVFAREYKGKVYVVDNHRISVTMRSSVVKAKQYADQGFDGKTICEKLERYAYNATIYVSVNTLDFLKKGGRITPTAAAIGTVLKIKPVLSIQGEKLDSYATVRGTMQKCEEKMIRACKNDLMNRFPFISPEQLHIGGAGAGLNPEEIAQWVEMIEKNFPGADVFYDPLSASISTHTGPGAVGIGISIDMD